MTLVLFVAACGYVPSAGTSPGPTSTPTATTSPVPTPSPTEVPTPSPSAVASPSPPAGFATGTVAGGAVASSTVTTVRVGQHAGYDRIVIEFAGGVPVYEVSTQAGATFTRSPRGDQVTLEGTSGVLIKLHSVVNWTSYTAPTTFHPGYPYLRQALLVENYEGYQQWALGVQGTAYIRVTTLGSPSRLVIDVTAV